MGRDRNTTRSPQGRTEGGASAGQKFVVADFVEGSRPHQTFSRLIQVILEMAAQRDIEQITVAELTRRAGIHRGTFYKYAKTPTHLLISALKVELDHISDFYFRGRSPEGIYDKNASLLTTQMYLDHVEKYYHIYNASASNIGSTASQLLSDHLTAGSLKMLQEAGEHHPFGQSTAVEVFAAFIGHGSAGAIKAWAELPEPKNHEQLFAILVGILNGWVRYSEL